MECGKKDEGWNRHRGIAQNETTASEKMWNKIMKWQRIKQAFKWNKVNKNIHTETTVWSRYSVKKN